jgi:pimeloyl-ACP methyl ester carboxylesterase
MQSLPLVLFILLAMLLGVPGLGYLFMVLAPARATSMALKMERRYSGLARKEVSSPDGVQWVYLDGGQGDALILVHGFGADKDCFVRLARWLTPHYRVIVPDLPGFGESAHLPELDYSAQAQMQRLHQFLQILGIANPHLAGNSMGGQIALSYAAAYPVEVASLWLFDPGGIWHAPAGELEQLIREQGRNPLIAKTTEEFAYTYRFVMSHPPYIPRPMLNVLAQSQISNVALAQKIFEQIVADSLDQKIAGLMTPALIVWGERDRVIPVATAGILYKLMPRSQLIIMPGIGHMPMLERPVQCASDYVRFRRQLNKQTQPHMGA